VITSREGLVIAALLAVAASPLVAQEPVQAPDSSVQGYAPPPAAAPAPAPAAAPAPAPAAAPAPTPAAAPAAAPAVPASPTAGRSVADALGFVDVIPARGADRIQNALGVAKATEAESDARASDMASQRAQTKAMIEMKKQEISSVDAKVKLADKQKAGADKITFEAEKKVAERQKQFLERREALYAAEIDQAKASKRFAIAAQKALQLELQLAERREDRARVAGTDPTRTLQHNEVIHELERKTLEAQSAQADAAKDVAARSQDLAKRRLDLYQAQMAASGSR
jgi:hypothetical protein